MGTCSSGKCGKARETWLTSAAAYMTELRLTLGLCSEARSQNVDIEEFKEAVRQNLLGLLEREKIGAVSTAELRAIRKGMHQKVYGVGSAQHCSCCTTPDKETEEDKNTSN